MTVLGELKASSLGFGLGFVRHFFKSSEFSPPYFWGAMRTWPRLLSSGRNEDGCRRRSVEGLPVLNTREPAGRIRDGFSDWPVVASATGGEPVSDSKTLGLKPS